MAIPKPQGHFLKMNLYRPIAGTGDYDQIGEARGYYSEDALDPPVEIDISLQPLNRAETEAIKTSELGHMLNDIKKAYTDVLLYPEEQAIEGVTVGRGADLLEKDGIWYKVIGRNAYDDPLQLSHNKVFIARLRERNPLI